MLTIVQKTDAEIEDQVCRELRWDCRTEKSPIMVSVTEGAVTLNGEVKYFAIKRAAEEAAQRIAGVASVQNNLSVRNPVVEFRGDCEIAEAITWAFEWNVLVPHEQVSVMVHNGFVTLQGSVDCLSQREEAERAVVNLLGVVGIANYIAVKAQPLAAETVSDDILSALERQSVATSEQVKVNVEEGAVRLSGTTPTWNHRCAAVSAARFAHGVNAIVDDLQIAIGA